MTFNLLSTPSHIHRFAQGKLTRLWERRSAPPRFAKAFDLYQHPIYSRLFYTPTLFDLLHATKSQWLLDDIAAWIGPITFHREVQREPRLATLHFSTLTPKRNRQTTLYASCPGVAKSIFVSECPPSTEFLTDEINLVATCHGALWKLRLYDEP